MRTFCLNLFRKLSLSAGICLFAAAMLLLSQQSWTQCQPLFTSSSEDISSDCGGELPPLDDCAAISNCCDGLVDVSSFTSESGARLSACDLSTASGPGVDWSVWLPMIDAPSVAWNFVGDGYFETYADGTAHIWGLVANAGDASLQLEVEMWLENGTDWAGWSALGRAYKNDLGFAGTNYLNWKYFELVAGFSRLTGVGVLEGTLIELSHQPANYFYGFQSGIGANNRNGNDGLSGWFTYEGNYDGESVSGHGDINVDQSCENFPDGCATTAFTRVCRAEDACGNIAFQDQTVSVTDDEAPVVDPFESIITVPCLDSDDVFITATDACSTVIITYEDEVIVPGCPGVVIRHYLVSDACGNSVEVSQTINILSEGELEFTEFPDDTEVECDQLEGLNPVIEWNAVCANTELTIAENIILGSCPNSYTVEYTYTLTDGCDNEVSQIWTVVVSDTEPPVFFDVPAGLTINCGDDIPQALPFAADNCGEVNITISAVTEQLSCGYNFIRTWTATDACGNSSEASQLIYVSDNVDPFFTFLPPSVVVECDENYVLDLALFEDACSDVDLSWTDISLGDCAGSYLRLWRAFDGCGNQALESTTVTIVDNDAPVMTSFPEDVVVNCDDVPAVEEAEIEFEDFCSAVEVDFDETTTNNECGYTIFRTWTLTDDCNNSSEWTWEIAVSDNLAPVLTGVPANSTLSCGDEIPDAVVEAIDNCDSEIQVSLNAETIQNECGYLFVRTWTAVDDCGNLVEASQTITVTDDDAPVFTFVPADVTLECSGGVASVLDIAEATDECSEVTITFEDEFTSDGCAGGYTRHWFATDGCGNVATADQQIVSNDEEAPVITQFPVDVTVDCDEIPSIESAVVEYEDDCGNVVILFDEEIIDGDCPNSYIIERTWSFTDGCGNSVSDTWTITVEDDSAPILIGVPENTSSDCGNEVDDAVVVAIDNCSSPENIVIAIDAITVPSECGYEFIRTWSATDECGNTAEASQVVLVEDNVPPVFTFVPADVNITCDGSNPDDAEPATATDDCSEVTITFDDEFNGGDCAGGFTRTWIATDGCGNFVTAQQQITSSDQEAPVITSFPDNVTVSCDNIPSAEEASVEYSDDCGSVITSYDEEIIPGSCPNSYNIERTWTFTDGCGNSVSNTWTIFVVDEEGPIVFGVPSNVMISCGEEVDDAVVTAIDNCSAPEDITISLNAVTEPTDCGFEFIRIWTVTDQCSNSTTLSQVVTVEDNNNPVFTFVPADINVVCGEDYVLEDAVATDDCSIVTVTATILDGSACLGGLVRVFTATDLCGNSVNAQQVITFNDVNAPEAINPPQEFMFFNCDEFFEVTSSYVQFEDDCSNVDVLFEEFVVPSDCPGSYSIFYSWTATDECNNMTQEIMEVFYVDQTPPVFTSFPDDLFLTCGDEIPDSDVQAEDDCSEVIISIDDELLGTGCSSLIVRTITASDACGNFTSNIQLITQEDETAPVFTSIPDDITVSCGDAAPEVVYPTIQDDCSAAVVTLVEMIIDGECPNTYTIIREFTASDVCGNSNTHVQSVSVVDDTAPIFENFEPQISVECGESSGVFVFASDNCNTTTVTYTDGIAPGAFGDCGNAIIRTYTATDACGNSSEIDQFISLNDNEAPQFLTFPEDGSFSCDEVPSQDDVVIEYIDNCSEVIADYNEVITPGECPNAYVMERTWTITDACGNNTSETWTINVTDTQAPIILNVPANIEVDCSEDIPAVAVFAFDNCTAEPIITLTATQEVIGCNTLFTRRWNAEDECGNSSEEIQVVTVTDFFPPVLSDTPDDLILFCGDDIPVADEITATDNCLGDVPVSFEETGNNGGCSTITRTWCATDCVGNEICHTQSIFFVDGISNIMVWQQSDANAVIRVTPETSGRWNVDVYDVNGKVIANVYSGEMKADRMMTFDLNIAQMGTGIYYVRFSNDETMMSKGFGVIR